MKPSIGQDVHYVARGSADGQFPVACRAAKVTEVAPETPDNLAQGEIEGWREEAMHRVGLCVINPTGIFFHSIADGGAQFSADNRGGTWHWPERVG